MRLGFRVYRIAERAPVALVRARGTARSVQFVPVGSWRDHGLPVPAGMALLGLRSGRIFESPVASELAREPFVAQVGAVRRLIRFHVPPDSLLAMPRVVEGRWLYVPGANAPVVGGRELPVRETEGIWRLVPGLVRVDGALEYEPAHGLVRFASDPTEPVSFLARGLIDLSGLDVGAYPLVLTPTGEATLLEDMETSSRVLGYVVVGERVVYEDVRRRAPAPPDEHRIGWGQMDGSPLPAVSLWSVVTDEPLDLLQDALSRTLPAGSMVKAVSTDGRTRDILSV